jgi:DNA repair protein RadC
MENHTSLFLEVSEVEMTYKSKQKPSERPKITGSYEAVKIFKSLRDYEKNMEYKEVFYCMYLNKANKVLSVMRISEGTVSGTLVDIKMILQPAILQNASGIIMCHNHPSGNLTPSEADKQLTKKVKESAKIMDVALLDHVILTAEDSYSFADEGTLPC